MPAVVKGPTVALSLPLRVVFMLGAPLSFAGFCVLPTQLPFVMICVDAASSTRLSISPLWMVMELWTKLVPLICTDGPVAILAVSTMAQAASRTVIVPNRTSPKSILLYIRVPFNISSVLVFPASMWVDATI